MYTYNLIQIYVPRISVNNILSLYIPWIPLVIFTRSSNWSIYTIQMKTSILYSLYTANIIYELYAYFKRITDTVIQQMFRGIKFSGISRTSPDREN